MLDLGASIPIFLGEETEINYCLRWEPVRSRALGQIQVLPASKVHDLGPGAMTLLCLNELKLRPHLFTSVCSLLRGFWSACFGPGLGWTWRSQLEPTSSQCSQLGEGKRGQGMGGVGRHE